MKHRIILSALLAGMILVTSSPVKAQNEAEGTPQKDVFGGLSIGIGGQALNLAGENSDKSEFGPFFRGRVGYAVIPDLTVFVESGYGWTGNEDNDDLKITQVPIIGGLTYDFGSLLSSPIVRPYIGAGAGIFMYRMENDGEIVTLNNEEQKFSAFGIEGVIGVNFRPFNAPISIDINAKYDHVFSKDDEKIGFLGQDWNAVSFGAGVSYYFGR
jgi:hypothetical protein